MTLHHKRNGQVLFHNINQNHSTAASANLCLQKTNKRVITFTIGNFTISKIAQTSQSNEDRFWISAFILISSPGTNPILSRWMVPETGPDLQHRQHIRLDPLLVVECCKKDKTWREKNPELFEWKLISFTLCIMWEKNCNSGKENYIVTPWILENHKEGFIAFIDFAVRNKYKNFA